MPSGAVPRFLQALACTGVTACASPPTTTTPEPPPVAPPLPIASLALAAADSIVFMGDSAALLATAYDSTGEPTTLDTVAWSGGNASISVNDAGRVVAIAPGTATITATSEGHSASVHLRAAYGATLSSLGGSISIPGQVSLYMEPSSLKEHSRVALVAAADPDLAVPNSLSITFAPGSFVRLAQMPSRAFTNFANGSAITFTYDPAQLPMGVKLLQLVVVDWIPAGVSPVGLASAWPLIDSSAHTLTMRGFQRPADTYGFGYAPGTPPITISASQPDVTLPRGGSLEIPIAVVRNNSAGAVSFTISNAQAGIAQSVIPASTTGNSVALSLTVASTAAPGVYPITVYAAPGGASTSVNLTVKAP